jgi:homeobox protein EMX
MMPSAQQVTTIKQSIKPRIGFSIDSIVGNRMKSSSEGYCDDSDDGTNYPTPKLPTAADLNNEYSNLMKRMHCISPQNNVEYDKSITRLSESSDQDHQNNNSSSNNSNSNKKNSSVKAQSRSPSPVQKDRPIIVPGIPAGLIRPQHHPQLPPAHYPDMSPAGHPHLLAQFQAAAALANVQAVQSGFNGHIPPHLHNPNIPRESYPLYPWLLSRHGRIFPHRFPGSEY